VYRTECTELQTQSYDYDANGGLLLSPGLRSDGADDDTVDPYGQLVRKSYRVVAALIRFKSTALLDAQDITKPDTTA
jgi:hypothetical protein